MTPDSAAAHALKSPPAPVIGLALGSGSARGWSHIGVIRALEAAGIVPQVVCGSSIGALVGAAYASGNLDQLEDWVRKLTWREVVRFMDITFNGGGFIEGTRLMDYFRKWVRDASIESLPTPFGAVATDLSTGREVWFQSGSVMDAVRASVALPGLFTPAELEGVWLVDGGLVNPVPVSLCRAMGAHVVIAVNLNSDVVGKHWREAGTRNPVAEKAHTDVEQELWEKWWDDISGRLQASAGEMFPQWFGPRLPSPGLFEVIAGSINIMQDRITRSRMAGDPPEVMLSPRLAHMDLLAFDRAAEAIAEGERCVSEAAASLRHYLAGA